MPHNFPQEAVLRNGKRVLIRPFNERDIEPLWQFFHGLPQETRRLAWHNIDDRAVVEHWGHNIDYFKALPLLAFDGDHVVADATLHRRHGGPLRFTGRIKWLIHPDYRGQGLGTILINNFISMARNNKMRFLTCLLFADVEADAVETLTKLGFESQVYAGYGADPDGNPHDMVRLSFKL